MYTMTVLRTTYAKVWNYVESYDEYSLTWNTEVVRDERDYEYFGYGTKYNVVSFDTPDIEVFTAVTFSDGSFIEEIPRECVIISEDIDIDSHEKLQTKYLYS